MLNTVLDLPQSFFDTTPLGRVINRFSKDVYMIDEQIPRSFLMFFRTLFSVIAILGVNAVGNPYYLVAAVPLGFLYYRIQTFYLSTSRQLKRLESTSRSPVYAHFQETLQGVSTIRAFDQTHRFIKQSELKVDVNTKAYYCSMSSNRYVISRNPQYSHFSSDGLQYDWHSLEVLLCLDLLFSVCFLFTLKWESLLL